jgi:hypothetical protein
VGKTEYGKVLRPTRAKFNIPAVNDVLATHLRRGGNTLDKEKYEKPEIITEVLEQNVLYFLGSQPDGLDP